MPLPAEIQRETTHMDRITQLQDATDQLVNIMYGSIDYLTRKASFKQVAPQFPITQDIPDSEDPAVFEESKKELVTDLLRKAKQIEFLIDSLPSASEEGRIGSSAQTNGDSTSSSASSPPRQSASENAQKSDADPDFAELEAELQAVNNQYLLTLDDAEQLQETLKTTIRSMLDEHHRLSAGLTAG